jgi:hypothetical protein
MAGALSHMLIFLSGGGVLVGRVYGRRPCFVSVRTIKGIIITNTHTYVCVYVYIRTTLFLSASSDQD